MVQKRVRVLLTRNAPAIGMRGEVREVKSGYAQNFLLPMGYAVLATPRALEAYERDHRDEEQKSHEELSKSSALMASLRTRTVTIALPKNEKGKLYRALQEQDVLDALREVGIVLPEGTISFAEPVKAVGTYTVSLTLPGRVSGSLKVIVV